ncbi:hypothetical protein I3760_15G113100 [Carya illinoinensis]|nr:hypothetical protein I3760_15G113100 [Carya illinoinensis]
MGSYQIRLSKYPFSGSEKHHRRFQASWFVQFGSWLEYSPSKDAAYCLPYYLFTMKASQRSRWDDPCSCHNNAVKSCEDLLKQSRHIDKVMNAQSSEQILNNRLRVKTSINVVQWLAFQGCAFRGHDETRDSKNRGNFLKMLKLFVSYNDKVGKLVLENAPKSSKYDGASNIRGEWNGLQALFLKDCPYAYYVHCFAYRLQLALVAASREVVSVHEFFSNLNFVINVVGTSCKRHDELQTAQTTHIAHMIAIDELESGKGANQIGTIKRAGDSRWGSHFYSIYSLLEMFEATYSVLEIIIKEGSTYSQRGDANATYKMIISFQFIFILHLMKEIMGITDVLYQVLQQKSQDILNAMNMVSTTKGLIQKLRNESWKNLLENVVSFSKKFDINIPELSSRYIQGRGHFQMQEFDNRFDEGTTKLLTLSSALDPKDGYKSFNIDDICCFAEEYYLLDFSENEKINLRSIADLCRRLVKTNKSKIYYLIDRLICLILTLPVSTATSEWAFSAMKIVKTRLHNKIEDEFLANNLVVYIEREIAKNFDLDSILDDFVCLKERKSQF